MSDRIKSDSGKAAVGGAGHRRGPVRSSPASNSSGIGPQLVLGAVVRWWKLALPAGVVLAAIAGAVVWWFFEPVFEASALIQIDARPAVIAFDRDGASYGGDQGYVATQINLLSSNIVLLGSDVYLKQPGAKSVVERILSGELEGWSSVEANDPELRTARKWEVMGRSIEIADWLRERISVRQAGKGSTIYNVSFSSPNAEFSKEVVNCIVQTYFDVLKAQRGEQDRDLLKLLRLERDRRRPAVKSKRAEFNDLIASTMQSGALVNLDSEAEDPRIALRHRRAEAEMERAVLNHRITLLEEDVDNPIEISDSQLQQALDNDPYVVGLRSQMRELGLLASDVDSAAATAGSPESDRIRKKMDTLLKQLESYRREVEPQVRESLVIEERKARSESLAKAREQLRKNTVLLEAMEKQQEELLTDMTAGNAVSLEAERKLFELELERDVLARIENRIIQLETESAAPPREELWRWADTPIRPVVEWPAKQGAMAMFPALLAPFLIAVAWEGFLRRVQNTDSLEQDLALAVVGEIARYPRKRVTTSVTSNRRLNDALRLFEESIDTLGTSLRLGDELKRVRVLAITSATGNEGKTSVASQLAISIAKATREKTLLIDGDMRSPDIHRVFDISGEPGLQDVLSGDCPLHEVVHSEWSENLDILTAGRLGGNPHRLLANGTARELFAEVARTYRYAIVDTPPVLMAGETLILCEAAEATLMCTMCDTTREDQVRRACKRLALAGVDPMGAVLNGVPVKRYLYQYGRYHVEA
ncbi:MAG: polysaccharide biosynthesis tyrosine autokinase [Planctomycetota bacterium]